VDPGGSHDHVPVPWLETRMLILSENSSLTYPKPRIQSLCSIMIQLVYRIFIQTLLNVVNVHVRPCCSSPEFVPSLLRLGLALCLCCAMLLPFLLSSFLRLLFPALVDNLDVSLHLPPFAPTHVLAVFVGGDAAQDEEPSCPVGRLSDLAYLCIR
jgi:hypothetical protein